MTQTDAFRISSRVAGMSESKTMAIAALADQLGRFGIDAESSGATK